MEETKLTPRQKEVCECIRRYMLENKRPPYIREIQDACSISSYKGTVDRLLALEKKGYIVRKLNKHRGIVLNSVFSE